MLPSAEPWTEAQQLAFEKESLGLYWSGHPIERYAAELKAVGAKTLAELAAMSEPAEDEEAARRGVVRGRRSAASSGPVRSLKTRKGDRMAAFPLDDPNGSIEVVAFPETFAKAQAFIQADTMVLVKGKFERDDETMRLLASEIVAIETVRERAARIVTIRLAMPPHGRATIEALAELLGRHKGDRRVCLELELRGGAEPLRVKADVARPDSRAALRRSSSRTSSGCAARARLC